MNIYSAVMSHVQYTIEGRIFDVTLNYYLSTITIKEGNKTIYITDFETYDSFDGAMEDFVRHHVKGM